ncbi:hypothetical protein [Microseira wollei]|uniref:Uncharacterized protein n=1 Tax=Microseira wollei NIES-4236 TaxID=2530354 RepID=A0AAV3XS06_9CYAN|nr:hypothetical protein [Microseira wollei]GET43180.1 hypothetical protein MiSe_80010 [Microseira wollei NIES-4236]
MATDNVYKPAPPVYNADTILDRHVGFHIQDLYHVRLNTHNHQPGHGTINVICLSEISSDAVSLRNDSVRFFYYGQFNGHDITRDEARNLISWLISRFLSQRFFVETRFLCVSMARGAGLSI